MKKLLFSGLMLLAAASQSLYAVQAKRDVVRTLQQPDGTSVQVMQRGDEAAHCYVTLDNLPVLQAEDGSWCFATLDALGRPVASDVKALNPDSRTAAQREFIATLSPEAVGSAIFDRAMAQPRARSIKASANAATDSKGVGLFNEVCFPSDGERHALVILVQYSDVKFTTNNPADYFDRWLNQEGFKDNGATGSVRDFYISGSDGRFTPHFDLYGPVTLKNRRSFYGGNNSWGEDLRPCQMVKEACELLDDEIDFSKYDLDNDGYVDNVYIIYAGQGEADYGPKESIWPHRWQLSADNVYCTLDGKTIENYGCCNEYGERAVANIGTFCHEFGHVMGLPDLYSTSYNQATSLTPGSWSVMDYGPYLNDGRTPPTFSAFERNALGWIDLRELSEAETVTLDHILSSNQACIIPTGDKNEFFLLENRQQTGWDAYLPGHGMLIWHIDYDGSIWDKNTVNNDQYHQYVDIEEANGLSDNTDDVRMAGYPFPGTSRVTSFTADTKPALKTWANKAIDVPITNITEKDGVITFDVCGGSLEVDTPVVTADDITSTSFVLDWVAVNGATNYEVSIFNILDNIIEGYPMTVAETSHAVKYLEPDTEYKATVKAIKNEVASEPSEAVIVTTAAERFEWMFPRPIETTNVSTNGFTANWMPVNGAVDYRLTVFANQAAAGEVKECQFATGSYVATEGWTTTAAGVYTSKDYSHNGDIPSLKLAGHGQYLCSPVYEKDITEISFWARGAGANAANYLEVEVRANDEAEWTLLKKIQPLVLTVSGMDVKITDIPAKMHQMRIVYYKPQAGNVAIDDVVVTLGGSNIAYHADYNAKSVGNVTSHTIEVPAARSAEEEQTMYYQVQAVNASGQTSFSSPLVTVNLTNNEGIDGVSVVAFPGEASTEYFDLEGRRVIGAPAPGVYIKRQGTNVEKVIIR